MRHNDNGLLNMSGVADFSSDHFPEMNDCDPQFRLRYALYCDGIFQNYACLFNKPLGRLTEWQRALYRRYNLMRVSIEHSYGSFKNMFPIFRFGRQLKLMDDAGAIQRLTVVCFFIYNCKICLRGSNTTVIYDIAPPTLEEYLPLNEQLEQAPYVHWLS